MVVMNIVDVFVMCCLCVVIMFIGDELVMSGDISGLDQIIVFNFFGLQVMLCDMGCEVWFLLIVCDIEVSLCVVFLYCDDVDLVIIIGGVLVGDYDFVGKVVGDLGMNCSFYKIVMWSGKFLMVGWFVLGVMMIGLSGNFVFVMVCGIVFVVFVICVMFGFGVIVQFVLIVFLVYDILVNGICEYYMCVCIENGELIVFECQDSVLLIVFFDVNVLVICFVKDFECKVGDILCYILI